MEQGGRGLKDGGRGQKVGEDRRTGGGRWRLQEEGRELNEGERG